jgi:hypothetical protein
MSHDSRTTLEQALVPYDVIRSQARYFWTWMAVKSHDAP